MTDIKKHLQKWLYVDFRVLALFRIIFGFLGLLDVLRRYHLIDVFYSSSGMNFKRIAVGKYSIKYFTLLNYFQTSTEVQLFFILTAISFFCLIIGYRTRLFQVLSAIGLISIHNAAVILENGGDMTFNNYLIWTMFLPLGRSLSIDSLRKSIRKIPENNAAELNNEIPKKTTYYFHFAYLACLVQLSMIYFYASINKTGAMWDDGTAVFYAFQLQTFLTPIGEWISQHMSFWLSNFMTHSAPHAQLFAPIGILSPIFQPWLRRIVFLIFISFHGIIEISFDIGLFGWVMFSALILLLSKEDIDILKKILSHFFNRKYTIYYNQNHAFFHFIARIIKRMDIFSRLTWNDYLENEDKVKKLNTFNEKGIIVWEAETDKIWFRHKGLSKIISALPLGFLFSWVLCVPGLERLFGYIYNLISKKEAHLSKIMGLSSACNISERKWVLSLAKKHSVVFSVGKKNTWIISNIFILILLIGAINYSTTVNKGYNSFFSKEENYLKRSNKTIDYNHYQRKMKRLLLYPRMHQNWNMFAPSVLRNEKWVIADITFINDEKISLFKGDEKIEKNFERSYFTIKNQFWRKFFSRINKTSHKKYIPQFKEWLKSTNHFSEYQGREVKEVKIWHLSERSPSLNTDSKSRPKVRKIELIENKRKKRTKKANRNK